MLGREGERGATLLDVVVGSALMTLVFTGIVGAFQLSVDAVSNNKARAGAIALTNERLEYIRSLSYDAIGTVGGIPSGAMEQTATSTLNDVAYTRRTFVSYEDDPSDGTGGADSNGVVVDYKAAKVSVSWNSRQGTRTITMVTRISPPTGIEVDVPGGTIVIHAVDSMFQPIANAQVRIMNVSLTPSIDLTTYTDELGVATVIGAPAGAGYAVVVTKAGLSSAQTYGVTATNTNPIPAHLGVALYQTTAATFEIDVLSNLEIQTFKALEEDVWTDSFADDTSVATSSAVVVGGGTVQLEGVMGSYAAEGELTSNALSVPYLSRWKELSWNETVPAGTDIVYHVYDSSYDLIPNNELAGNAGGFTTSPVNLTGLSTSTYSLLRVGATLSSADPNETPVLNAWSVTYDVGPEPLPNLDFEIHGAKIIGSASDGSLIYKYEDELTTSAQATAQLNNIEWDLYTMSVPASTDYDIASSCPPQPLGIIPATSVVAQLYLSPHTANSLLVDVRDATSAIIPNATVQLSRTSYDTSIAADQCGQAFFMGLSAGSVGTGNPYTIEVSASGYTSYTSSEVNVSGTTRLSVILN